MKVTTRRQAMDMGEGKYYPDNPCKNGHKAGWYTVSGQCIECKKERRNADLQRFYRRRDLARQALRRGITLEEILEEVGE